MTAPAKRKLIAEILAMAFYFSASLLLANTTELKKSSETVEVQAGLFIGGGGIEIKGQELMIARETEGSRPLEI